MYVGLDVIGATRSKVAILQLAVGLCGGCSNGERKKICVPARVPPALHFR